MNKDIAEMDSATSRWPDNLDTASVLAIRSPCVVTDAYQLICDRKNIRTLIVSGQEYTAQEVRNMPFGEKLGKGVVPEDPMIEERAWPAPPAYETMITGEWRPSIREEQIRARLNQIFRAERPTVQPQSMFAEEISPVLDGYTAVEITW